MHATHRDDASGSLRHRFEVATPFADVETFSPITEPADFDRFNVRLGALGGRPRLRLAAQTPELLADGLHYEERIARHGVIATRPGSSHDAFNAEIWLRHCALKRAMNARQVADIARVGPKQRTRGQCALTHFDEAGAIVWLDGSDLVDAWDAHDWPSLFATHRDAWGSRIAVTVIGHALYDYALAHRELPVAKALAVRVDRDEIAARSRDCADHGVAGSRAGHCGSGRDKTTAHRSARTAAIAARRDSRLACRRRIRDVLRDGAVFSPAAAG